MCSDLRVRACGIHQVENKVDFVDGLPRNVHHGLVERIARFVDTGGIEIHDLSIGMILNPTDLIPRRLCNRRCDRDLLAHKIIHQS